ncbi:3-hydroxyacyl-CoA dehydrogenase NAD-binding domain-containing protein [Arthrobacter roseus]|uniref:3-hydroxyacyl-CoA dehydrogenase NAD-binding domain-containing protein n=1 Tax=Arthrobacter roseus TaxID=136274 RepID=UPI001965B3F7|nr:3-hydroxyacyl-CoA dehydrogenase NAD-binding domain-containing protein [Arthrobacter roseus]MBM7847814.1 3-hydroxyacyl-CoA dehydrogenase [Arthrobacter roseus]
MTSQPVSVQITDGVAHVRMDNPPVNALGLALREALMDALAELEHNDDVMSVLLIGQPKAFSAGADITEFGTGTSSPTLPELVARVEDFPKPVVAAITGVALGGGLELAMAAHARVALTTAKLGLPEISLGLLPGAGGTGRLPRLVGPEKALELILGGKQIPAEAALQDGLVDAVLDGGSDAGSADSDGGSGFETEAARWTAEFAASGGPMRTQDRTDKIADAAAKPGTVVELAATALRKVKDPFAGKAAVEAVTAGVEKSFERGAVVERAKFQERLKSSESAAQRYLFAAERAARKPRNLDPAAARDVKQAGVVGAGTMGGGIAMALVSAGIPVTVVEAQQEALERGLGMIEKNLAVSVSHGNRTEKQAAQQRALITGTMDYADLSDADLVIEAAFEDLQVKKEIFAKLDQHVKPQAVLATNTSYLDIDEIASGTEHADRVLGMHFFSPANVMPLVEVVRGAQTSPEALATGFATARRIGKTPVVVGVCHGFVGNRMLGVRSRQAEQLLLEGALPSQVDDVLTEFGFRMGPFAMADMAGLDIGWRNRKAQGTTAPIGDALCVEGRFGQKTGAGYYSYEGRDRQNDPEVEEIIERVSAEHNMTRRGISDDEILERLLFPMINEGARILEEKIADRASDIDVIWVKGYNWPAYRGGPMWYADQVGAAVVAERLTHYAEATGDESLRPASALQRAADVGGSLTGASSS